MKKVVTLGEMMIRFMPKGNLRFEQATEYEAFYGGDESIVAVSLARFGLNSAYVTKLPQNPLGDIAVNKLREQGVDTRYIARGGERMGLNFYESGVSMRPSNVLYDRRHSSMAEAVPEDFDFDAIFSDADWFHVAGITPAISDNAAELTAAALKCAKKHNVTVSVDLNYRSKLWTPEKAQQIMRPLMQYVDVCIGNEEDAEKVLGFKPDNTDVNSGKLDIEGYRQTFLKLRDAFHFRYIASTLRESYSASDNGWSSLVFDGEHFYRSRKYDIRLVDRGGGGASFAAALIYALLNDFSLEKAGEFATAASALKQTILGDFNLSNLPEVYALMNGNVSGRVQR
ncbi:sugar kinase [uncultured Flavonifractor sp.]|uniref:PfkB family carbohydrate kinase n=1 Tax=uncultured Flavonifractor sp. TaxID=1193534 RepID=UPI002617B336|nr:sugar kinase [uncultured Flavonifractor sp.]